MSSLTFSITPVPYPTNFSLWCVPSNQRMLSHLHGLPVVVMNNSIALQGVLRGVYPGDSSFVERFRLLLQRELL